MSKRQRRSNAEQPIKEGTAKAVEELRRQFDITQENLQPFIEAGTGALPDFIEGSTLEGISGRLSDIFDTDIFGNLVKESRNILESGASAFGLTRSGSFFDDLSKIPLQEGLGLEGLLQGRLGNLVGLGSGTSTNVAQLGAQKSGNIASLFQAQGSQVGTLRAQGAANRANARNSFTQGLLNAGATLGSASILASDPMLKTNVEHISDVGNLKMYQWDWVKEIADTFIGKFPTIGFMADEVEEKYPEFVYELCGIKAINYGDLMDRLETDYGTS